MKNISSSAKKLGVAAIVSFCSAIAFSAPGQLSNVPLFLGSTVPPNILFVIDDSGSMNWEILRSNGSEASYWNFSTSGNIDITPTDTDVDELMSSCVGFNTMYFDPNAEYTPWVGVDINGDTYEDQPIIGALNFPYDPSDNAIDLTRSDGGGDPSGYIPWDDANGNGDFDIGECGDVTTNGRIDGTTVDYSRFVAVADMDSVQQTNFANWYSYYRKREYVAKRAVSEIMDVGRSRMGLATLHNNNSVGTLIEDIDDISTPVDASARANKLALKRNLFRIDSDNGTPLRQTLEEAGQYFESGVSPGRGLFGFNPNPSSPILSEAEGGACQQNFTVLLSDGFWNGSSAGVGNTDIGSDSDFDGGSYADTQSETLADVAMHYYERDLATSLADSVPVTAGVDENSMQHMVTFTVAFGVNGTLSENPLLRDEPFAWPFVQSNTSTSIDDMRHAAWNGRGEFLSAGNPQELIDTLSASIDTIQDRTGSASAVAFNTTSVTVDTFVYQARFDSGAWNGSLRAFEFDQDGVGDVVWDAADELNDTSFNFEERAIFTNRLDIGKGVPFKFPDDYSTAGDDTGLSADQIADLLKSAPNPNNIADTQLYGEQITDFIRGDYSNDGIGRGFRDRGEHRLGDIVHSSPEYVGVPAESYPNLIEGSENPYFDFVTSNNDRTPIVYVGANDGMLHAFHALTGEEYFGFIPGGVYSDDEDEGLHVLAEPNYVHRPYVDSGPVSRDVFIDGEWRTYLVGGLRAGGKSVFVLDVTNPDDSVDVTESAAEKLVVTEFTDDDLGFTFSTPQIAKMNNRKWAAIFGNGYNSDPDGDGTAKLFVLYLDGSGHEVFETNVGSISNNDCGDTASDCNGMSSPTLIDLNGDFRVDRIYSGDIHGNLWAFDVTDENDTLWASAVGRPGSPVPLFSACESSTCTQDNRQPITAKPVVAPHPQIISSDSNPNLIVMFGTGQFIAEDDNLNKQLQTVYGVWDNGRNEDALTRSSLIEQDIEDNSVVAAGARALTSRNVPYSEEDDVYGWLIDLDGSTDTEEGERLVVDPLTSGPFVFFNTTIPDDAQCSAGGSGFLMVADILTGGMPSQEVFLSYHGSALQGIVAGLPMDSIPGGSVIIGDQIVVSNSRGEIETFEYASGSDDESRRASWSILK